MSLRTVTAIFLIALMFIIPIASYLVIQVPADVEYGNLFGATVIQATQGDATLQGILQDLQQFNHTMYQTFPNPSTWNTTYNSPFPWAHTRDNSLGANVRYVATAIQRDQEYITLLNKSSSGSLVDLQNQYVSNMRAELNASGGLDWAVRGAWYLEFAPLAYWLFYEIIIFEAIMLAAVLATMFLRRSKNW